MQPVATTARAGRTRSGRRRILQSPRNVRRRTARPIQDHPDCKSATGPRLANAQTSMESPGGLLARWAAERSVVVPVGDREAPSLAERPRRHPEHGGCLAPLVLALDDELEDAPDQLFGEASLDQPARSEVLLHV